MQILWPRVLGLVLAVLAIVVVANWWPAIVGFVKSIDNVRPYATPEEQTAGLIAFAVVALFILALIRVLLNNQRKK